MDPTARTRPGPPTRPFQLSLGETMLWVALSAVCPSAATATPPLGVVAGLILVPILGRASRIVHRRTALGRPADASTWAIAFAGSIAPVLGTWFLTAVAFLGTLWAMIFLGAWLVALFPALSRSRPAAWAGYGVVASAGALAACAAFFASALHSWAIREHEVGRSPWRDPPAGEKAANAAPPGG